MRDGEWLSFRPNETRPVRSILHPTGKVNYQVRLFKEIRRTRPATSERARRHRCLRRPRLERFARTGRRQRCKAEQSPFPDGVLGCWSFHRLRFGSAVLSVNHGQGDNRPLYLAYAAIQNSALNSPMRHSSRVATISRRLTQGRNGLVRQADAAGIAVNRTHALTGIARTTVYPILGAGQPRDAKPNPRKKRAARRLTR